MEQTQNSGTDQIFTLIQRVGDLNPQQTSLKGDREEIWCLRLLSRAPGRVKPTKCELHKHSKSNRVPREAGETK